MRSIKTWLVVSTVCALTLTTMIVSGSVSPAPGIPQGAQSNKSSRAEAGPAFEAASVKVNRSGSPARSMGPEPGGRFGAQNVPLRDLAAIAYGIPPLFAAYRIAGGPDWLDTTRFDVSATAGRDLPPADVSLRVRRMLSDRFALMAHWETRDLPVYALVQSDPKRALGPRLSKSDIDCAALRAAARGAVPPSANGAPQACTGRTIPGTITGVALSLDTLANSLARFAGPIVQNETGLSGAFNYELTWTPDAPIPAVPGATVAIDPNGASLFTAVQEQLGLRLESRRAPIEVLILDHAELPSPD